MVALEPAAAAGGRAPRRGAAAQHLSAGRLGSPHGSGIPHPGVRATAAASAEAAAAAASDAKPPQENARSLKQRIHCACRRQPCPPQRVQPSAHTSCGGRRVWQQTQIAMRSRYFAGAVFDWFCSRIRVQVLVIEGPLQSLQTLNATTAASSAAASFWRDCDKDAPGLYTASELDLV